MPTINKRFLFQLLLVVALVTGTIVGIHTIQAARIPDALKRQADRAVVAEKTDTAIRYLRQYLEFRPNDADIQEQLATLLRARSGDSARTELVFLYDKILRTDPSRQTVRREAIITCLQLKRYSDAAAHAEALLKDLPNDADVWRYLGRAQVGLRSFDAAKNSFERAIECDPNTPIGYQQLAEFHWLDRNQLTEARAIYDRMIAALPESAEAYFARAKFLARSPGPNTTLPTAKDDPVLTDLRKALTLDAAHAESTLLLGERLQRHRDLLTARQVFLDGLKHHPNDERIVRSLAWLEVHRGNRPGAIRVLEDAIERSKDGFELLMPLADLLIQSGDVARTRAAIDAIERRRGTNWKLRVGYLRGRLAMHSAQWDDAIEELTAVRGAAIELPALETQANILLANCYARRGESAKSIECLQLVTLKEPGNLAARFALATALLDAGQLADAIREFDSAANHTAATPAMISMAVQLKALRMRQGGASDESWKELERLAVGYANRLGTKKADGGLILAELATASGKTRIGLEVLQKALAHHANDVRVWTKLAELVADAYGLAAALRVLDEAQGVLGDNADLRIARADLYARDPARLRPLANLESQVESWSEDDQVRLIYGLIEAHDRLGNRADVLRLYRRVVARRPRDADAWLAICERAWQAGDLALAREAESTLESLDEKPAETSALCVAWRELASGKSISVRDQLGVMPRRADCCRVLARQCEAENRLDRVRELLARAVVLEPVKFESATAYLGHLAATKAEVELKRYVGILAVDPRWSGEPLRRAVRSAALSIKDPDLLIKVIAPVVDGQPDGIGWLADLYSALGRSQDALTMAERAVRRPTATPDDWLRLAMRTAESSGRDAGAAIVNSAKSTMTPIAFADLVAAFTATPAGTGATFAIGRSSEIRLRAEAQLAILTSQLDRAAAIRLCETVLAEPSLRSEDLAWVRRKLAMLLTVRGEPSDRTRALELLAGESNGSPGERRATATVLVSLARFIDGAERSKATTVATEIFEKLASEPSREQRQDALALIGIYRDSGRTEDAVKVLQSLLNAQPDNVEYLLLALNILNSSQQPKAAQPFAERVLGIAPNDYRVVAAVARYECQSGRHDRAIELADAYERTADLASGEAPYKTAQAGELLDQLSKSPGTANTPAAARLVDAAVAKYEAVLHVAPQRLADLAAALAANGRALTALERIEQLNGIVPDRYRAIAGLTAMRIAGLEGDRVKVVRQWLTSAITHEPASIPLQLAEAEYYLLVNDLAAAERVYESVLKADERNPTALNNLAWILAPRPDATSRATALIERAARETGLTAELLDTRARIRIAARQPELAEKDAAEALRQEKTPLRYFHLALAQLQREPESGRSTFREAKRRGLDARIVHPLDRDLLAKFE